MTNKEKLKELLIGASISYYNDTDKGSWAEVYSDYLDSNGVIVLPCKVGDTVYKVWYTKCHNGNTMPDSYDCCGCYDECDMKRTIFKEVVPNIEYIFKNLILPKNNSVYFLTEEEAQEELKKYL